MQKEIYITPTQKVPFGQGSKTLSKEIATRSRSMDYFGLGMYLPNPDIVLNKLGKRITVYKELRTDAHVGGCVRRRKAAVKALEWAVGRDDPDSKEKKAIEQLFEMLDISRIVTEMLDAFLYGYKPIEVIWQKVNNQLMPIDLVGKPPEWFVYDEENQLRFLSKDYPIDGEPVPERKFLVARQEATYENPYGFADMSMIFWPTTFKKGGLKFWVTFTEKYGAPWVIGKHPRSTNGIEDEKFLDTLESMVQDAVAVIPDDSSVEIKEAAGKSSSADVFEKLLSFCRSEVSIALLGQNQTTEADTTNASAQVGLLVTRDIRDGDTAIVCEVFNDLIKWFVDVNFGSGVYPKFTMYEQEDVDKILAERDQRLTQAGARFTPNYFKRAYSLEDGDLYETAAPVIVDKANVAFAENDASSYGGNHHNSLADQQSIDDALDSLSNDLGGVSKSLLLPVFEKVKSGASLESIMTDLESIYQDMPIEDLQEQLARILFVSKVWGRLNGQD